MKIQTRARLEEGHWGQEETVTQASWSVSQVKVGTEFNEVRVYVLNESKRMMILSFKDRDEVIKLAKTLLESVEHNG